MKRMFSAIVIIGILLVAIFFVGKKQFTESQSAASVAADEEQGSFLKTEPELSSLQNSLANLLAALEHIRNMSSTPTNQIEEAGSIRESTNNNWWLNSGGRLYTLGNITKTIQGSLNESDRWHQEYSQNNPVDTDNGLHPQNILRLVQRGSWNNLIQQAYFQINKINLSSSPNRNASNGLFLFNRYQSGDNLYYTGLRVDGAVVIKKKMDGIYYTMAYEPIFVGDKYDSKNNPNLLPLNTWIGLRSEIITNPNGTVTINLYTDINRTGNWVLALQAVDDGVSYGGAPITKAGFAGIRTDFMDAQFDAYSIHKI